MHSSHTPFYLLLYWLNLLVNLYRSFPSINFHRFLPCFLSLELRSRIWLGDFNRVDDDSVMPLWCINCLGNSKFFRYTKAPHSVAKGTHSLWFLVFLLDRHYSTKINWILQHLLQLCNAFYFTIIFAFLSHNFILSSHFFSFLCPASFLFLFSVSFSGVDPLCRANGMSQGFPSRLL